MSSRYGTLTKGGTGWLLVVLIFGGLTATVAQEPSSGDWTTRQGRYIHLITDQPDSPLCDQWVAAFDAAVPQWLAYWQQPSSAAKGWRVTAYLMTDPARFRQANYLPATLPAFEHGFQQRDRIWVYHQDAAYYNRHLLLHEGAHALAWHLFGELGPPWFSEGTAEWLSTHNWPHPAGTPNVSAGNGQPPTANVPAGFTVGVMPDRPASAAGWGRIELIQQAITEHQMPPFLAVMRQDDSAHRAVQSYALSWLAMLLIDSYPEYRTELQQLIPKRFASSSDTASGDLAQLNQRLFAALRSDWGQLTARWQLLALDIDYGWQADTQRFQWPKTAPPQLRRPVRFTLQADHGWQAVPVALQAGQSVSISATGRYTVRAASPADPQSRPWQSEPDGISIQHYRGQRLGRLVACLLPLHSDPAARYLPPLSVVGIGAAGQMTATADCLLLLKINEPPGEYADNRGTLAITITAAELGANGIPTP